METDGLGGVSEIECFQGMAEKAKSIGANAIIVKSADAAIARGGGLLAIRYPKVRGVAIKYTDR
jgi:uncharacterized protein YbjQ (UPF0145 family)